VRRGFVASQFDKAGVYCIGIDRYALDSNSDATYKITIGNNKDNFYFLDRSEVEKLIRIHGEDKIVRKRGLKDIYVIPVHEMRMETTYDDLFDF
jgi:hypothetical protein